MNLPDWHPIEQQSATAQKDAVVKVQQKQAVPENDTQKQVATVVQQQAAAQQVAAQKAVTQKTAVAQNIVEQQTAAAQQVVAQQAAVEQQAVAQQAVTQQAAVAQQQSNTAQQQKSVNGVTTTSEQQALPAPQQVPVITPNTVKAQNVALGKPASAINLPPLNVNLPVNVSVKKL